MQTTGYFDNEVLKKRTYLTKAMCEAVVNNPLHMEQQEDGRYRYWGFVKELDKVIRVVVLEDGKTIHNAFMDRNFKQ